MSHVIVYIDWIDDIARVEIKNPDLLSFLLHNRIGFGEANFTCHMK
jgi:hypothetical protein